MGKLSITNPNLLEQDFLLYIKTGTQTRRKTYFQEECILISLAGKNIPGRSFSSSATHWQVSQKVNFRHYEWVHGTIWHTDTLSEWENQVRPAVRVLTFIELTNVQTEPSRDFVLCAVKVNRETLQCQSTTAYPFTPGKWPKAISHPIAVWLALHMQSAQIYRTTSVLSFR